MMATGSTNEFCWSYLPGSDLKETLVYPNGDVVRREYEAKRDLLTLVSNATHSTYRYTYDEARRRTFENDEDYGSYENLEAEGTGVGCNSAGANCECCCKENFTL